MAEGEPTLWHFLATPRTLAVLAAWLLVALLAANMFGTAVPAEPLAQAAQRLALKPPQVNATIAIYKNGELVYKHSDPVTETWIRAIFATFLRVPGISYGWTYEDGTNGNEICTEAQPGTYGPTTKNPAPYIELGTGQYTPAHTITALNTLWQRQPVKWFNIQFNGTEYIITYTTTFPNPDTPVTITEAGLSILTCGHYLLVAYDTISPGIQLNTTDTLTVQYTLVVKVSQPFTQNFYAAMIGYGLGAYKLYADSGQSVATFLQIKDDAGNVVHIDTDVETYSAGMKDLLTETLKATYNIGAQVTDTFALYHVNHQAYVDIQTPSLSFNYQNATILLSGQAFEDFKSSITVYGLALYLYTDTNAGTGQTPGYILMAYIPFQQPVSLPDYSMLGTRFTVGLQIG